MRTRSALLSNGYGTVCQLKRGDPGSKAGIAYGKGNVLGGADHLFHVQVRVE
jgi:hypothetical protein